MARALALAKRGLGSTSPNPMVGAVVVADDRELGSGWHRGPGKPHAEVEALTKAGSGSRGASIYVSLEPCVHHGRTPPCTDALIEAGIGRVVVATEDPDPQVSGRGLEALRAAGLEVSSGVLEEKARSLNAVYFHHRTLGRPYVTYKAAVSLDGRLAAADRSSKWITADGARRDVQRLRAISDAICVGVETVLTDDPMLTVREVSKKRDPLRVVVDSSARTPPDASVLTGEPATLVVVTQRAPAERIKRLADRGAEVVVISSEGERVSLEPFLGLLAERGVLSLLLEGGGTLAGSFAAAGLIDRYVLYVAPKLIGALDTTGLLEGWAAPTVSEAEALEIVSIRRLGPDLKIVAHPVKRKR